MTHLISLTSSDLADGEASRGLLFLLTMKLLAGFRAEPAQRQVKTTLIITHTAGHQAMRVSVTPHPPQVSQGFYRDRLPFIPNSLRPSESVARRHFFFFGQDSPGPSGSRHPISVNHCRRCCSLPRGGLDTARLPRSETARRQRNELRPLAKRITMGV